MLTPEEIQKIRSDAGVAPLESQQSQGQSLSERLGISTQGVPLTSKLGFVESVKQDFAERVEGVEEAADIYQRGEQSLASGALQVAGEAVGGLTDFFMRALSSLTPDIIEKPIVAGAEKIIIGAAETDIGQDIAKRIAEWANQNPEASKNLEAIVNIASVLPAGKAAQIGGKLFQKAADPVIKATGTALKESGAKVLAQQTQKFVRELVRPLQGKKVREAQVPRTTEKGRLAAKRSTIAPSDVELLMEKYVLKVPGIAEGNTLQGNYNLIRKEVVAEADRLIQSLKANDFTYAKKELLAKFKEVKEGFKRNPTLTGDAELTANKLIAEFERRIGASTGKGSDLLQIRKDFDAWVKAQKGSAIFDPNKTSAFSIANRDIRQAVNTFLDEKAPQSSVKESFKKQSSLYKALETLTPKAATEADTAMRRALDVWSKIIGTKSRAIQIIAAGVGIGGLGAAATFAPIVATAGIPTFLVYRLGKLALAPEVRKALGTVLLEVEKKKAANIAGRAIGGVTPTVLKEIEEDIKKLLEEY